MPGGAGVLGHARDPGQHDLTGQENRARDVLVGDKAGRAARFFTIKGDARALGDASLAPARLLVGLKGYVTSIPATVKPVGDVIASYRDLWWVEQSFRVSKTDLAARPIFVGTNDATAAHLAIVSTALAVTREVQALRQARDPKRDPPATAAALGDRRGQRQHSYLPARHRPRWQAILDVITSDRPHGPASSGSPR